MFTDSYDLHLFQSASQIVTKFKKFNAKVVFGAEYFCSPDNRKAEKFPNVNVDEKRFLNSGGYIGYVSEVYSILNYIINVLKMEKPSQEKCVFVAPHAVNLKG